MDTSSTKYTLWTSNAQWPEGTGLYFSDPARITTDTHFTKEQAEGVCDLLMLRGFGGDRQIFPSRVWVEEFQEESV